jgi:hypothetical protein
MTRRWFSLLLALALLGSASALDLSVEPMAGLDLQASVDAALGDWRAAGVDVDTLELQIVVRAGRSELFGPDVDLFVVVRGGSGDDDRRVEVLVNPAARNLRAALIPAFGVALGGVLGSGAFDPVLDATGPRRPTTADGALLEATRSALPGDLNRDGRIDFEDLLLLAGSFGRQGVNLPGDLNGDGVIDQTDLDLLREGYTFTPPTP